MDHPLPGLKYVSATDLDRSKKRFGNFTVEDPAGEKLGKLEGFILDVDDAIPYYVVVNAGGWFRSKHVLVPIGHVALDSDSKKLVTDVPRERMKRFPGFDLDQFPTLAQADLDRMADEIGRECCPDVVIEPGQVISRVEVWAHYRTPEWWDQSYGADQQAAGKGARSGAESRR
jgi:PRC-barrel domain protein